VTYALFTDYPSPGSLVAGAAARIALVVSAKGPGTMAAMRLPRFQFRLRTLMIAVTLLAVPLGYLGWQAKIVRARTETLHWLASLNCRINTPTDTMDLLGRKRGRGSFQI
jgi:hypothetical protein